MAQLPNMNWMGDQPTGSAYDVYQYYLGGGSPGGTTPTSGGGTGIMQAYQPTAGDGNFNQNIRTQKNFRPTDLGYYGNIGTVGLPGNINQRGPGRQFQYDATGKSYDDIGLYGGPVTKETLGQRLKGNPLVGGLLSMAMPGFGALKAGAQWLGGKLPVNKRAIMENEMLGAGFALDDSGKIARGSGDYDTAGNIFAGYNAAQMDEDTFDDRLEKVMKGKMSAKGKKKRADAIKAAKNQWQDAKAKRDAIYEQKQKEKAAAKKGPPTTGQGGQIDPGDVKDIGGGFHEYKDSGTAASYEGSFKTGGMVKDLSKDPEYRGWKKMYEANPGVGSMHDKHPTFIKFYKQHERDKKKFGGLAGLLYG